MVALLRNAVIKRDSDQHAKLIDQGEPIDSVVVYAAPDAFVEDFLRGKTS
jgi:hypothetical protein